MWESCGTSRSLGAALTTENQNAIDAIGKAANTGFNPNVVAADSLFKNSTNDGAANSLLTRLNPILQRQQMFAYVDVDDASIAVAKTYADANKGLDFALVYGNVNTSDTTGLSGAVEYACETIANDAEFNVSVSPSNRPLRRGVTGVSPELTFSFQDDDLQAGDLGAEGSQHVRTVGTGIPNVGRVDGLCLDRPPALDRQLFA